MLVGGVLHVVGARPNFMKAAPVMGALAEAGLSQVLVHTGQHYDAAMSENLLRELALPRPDVHLGVGSGSQACQTAKVMERIEPHLMERAPAVVVVYGDVNSTLAAALVASKLRIPVAHVEAGLRSGDRSMPEELNRLVVDQLSDILFTHCAEAGENLAREGIDRSKIEFVGNVMVDTLLTHRPQAKNSRVLDRLGLKAQAYAICTLHRPSNVDELGSFAEILSALEELSRANPVVFSVHPRTRAKLDALGRGVPESIRVIEPQGYHDFMRLMADAKVVLTDSGGIQEETTILRVPCVTVRTNTERPVTIQQGTNVLGGASRQSILAAVEAAYAKVENARTPEKWDGAASKRIARALVARLDPRLRGAGPHPLAELTA